MFSVRRTGRRRRHFDFLFLCFRLGRFFVLVPVEWTRWGASQVIPGASGNGGPARVASETGGGAEQSLEGQGGCVIRQRSHHGSGFQLVLLRSGASGGGGLEDARRGSGRHTWGLDDARVALQNCGVLASDEGTYHGRIYHGGRTVADDRASW